MAKRLIKPDGLWTPPHLRRGPERPPTGRRFVSRRCCCTTGPVDCGALSCPASFAVDLGAGGWVDGTCGNCGEFNGVFVADFLTSFPFCVWEHVGLSPPCSDDIQVSLQDPDTTASFFFIGLIITRPIVPPIGVSRAEYSSSTWDSIANPTCLHLADGDGKITLTKDSESHLGGTCSGTMPATITIEDAAP